MKPIQLAPLLCAVVALASPAAAQWFVRPSVVYIDYQNSGFASKAGLSLAAGSIFGAESEHELGLEVAYLGWGLTQDRNAGGSAADHTSGSGHFIPWLVNYRYHFGAQDAAARFYAGASLGLADNRGDLTQDRSGAVGRTSFSEWSTTFGAAVGVTFRIAGTMEFDLGYRYLHIGGSDPGSGSNRIPMDAAKANLLHAGLNFRF